jgi:hypothetical protein
MFHSTAAGGCSMPPNKGMKLTKLSAAWLPEWTCRLMPAPSGSHAGTASQLIPGVGRAMRSSGENERVWLRIACWRIAERVAWARARCAPYSAYGTHLCKAK